MTHRPHNLNMTTYKKANPANPMFLTRPITFTVARPYWQSFAALLAGVAILGAAAVVLASMV